MYEINTSEDKNYQEADTGLARFMKREIERGSLLNDRRKVDGELEGDRLIV